MTARRERLAASVHMIPTAPDLPDLVGGWVAQQLNAATEDRPVDWQTLRIQSFADPTTALPDRVRLDLRITAVYDDETLGVAPEPPAAEPPAEEDTDGHG